MTSRFIALLVAAAALPLTVAPAFADGKIDCRGGPRAGWVGLPRLQDKLTRAGWKIKRAEITRDCYEVYARTPEGDNVESFWHPVTLDKILVNQHGRILYRAPGY